MKVYIMIKTWDTADEMIVGVYANDMDASNDLLEFGNDKHIVREYEVIE